MPGQTSPNWSQALSRIERVCEEGSQLGGTLVIVEIPKLSTATVTGNDRKRVSRTAGLVEFLTNANSKTKNINMVLFGPARGNCGWSSSVMTTALQNSGLHRRELPWCAYGCTVSHADLPSAYKTQVYSSLPFPEVKCCGQPASMHRGEMLKQPTPQQLNVRIQSRKRFYTGFANSVVEIYKDKFPKMVTTPD